jgi:hypothetical protein
VSTSARIAILGTPRSGNTWLRAMLRSMYALPDFAEHDPADIPWDELPPHAIVNLHALPTPILRKRLADFRVVAIVRHPLDTLISILHFAPFHSASDGWLLGQGGGEGAIRGATPVSPEFVEYATGPRTAALFSVSRLWWDVPGVIRVRYEDLVENTVGELSRVAAELQIPIAQSAENVAKAHALDAMRGRHVSYRQHVWKGRPGHWRRFLPKEVAERIAAAHRQSFTPLGYACDPNKALDEETADVNWARAMADTVGRLAVDLAATRQRSPMSFRASPRAPNGVSERHRKFAARRESLVNLRSVAARRHAIEEASPFCRHLVALEIEKDFGSPTALARDAD